MLQLLILNSPSSSDTAFPSYREWLEPCISIAAAVGWIVLALVLTGYVLQRLRKSWKPEYMELTALWTAASLLWWVFAGGLIIERTIVVAAVSMLGLSAGTLIGFVFTSYSEESQSVGKVRDLMLAGLATLSIAELATGADHLVRVLALFADPTGVLPLGVQLASAAAFAVVGFLGSFTLRELFLNPSLAKARNERKKLESALTDVPAVLRDYIAQRPSVLAQFGDGDNLAPEARAFAHQVVLLVKASKICTRALPKDQSLLVAECLSIDGDFATGASIFEEILERFGFDAQAVEGAALCYERMNANQSAVILLEKYKSQMDAIVNQWLGFYLLWDMARLEDAVRYMERYLRIEPDDPTTSLNLACAFAQLFALEERPADREKALVLLKRVWEAGEDFRVVVRKLFRWDGDFFVFRKDQEFAQFMR